MESPDNGRSQELEYLSRILENTRKTVLCETAGLWIIPRGRGYAKFCSGFADWIKSYGVACHLLKRGQVLYKLMLRFLCGLALTCKLPWLCFLKCFAYLLLLIDLSGQSNFWGAELVIFVWFRGDLWILSMRVFSSVGDLDCKYKWFNFCLNSTHHISQNILLISETNK